MPCKNEKDQTCVTLTEIAIRWGVTHAAVSRFHVGEGKLRSTRRGQAHLVPVDQLSEYEGRLADKIRKRIATDSERVERLNEPLPPDWLE